MIDRVIAEIDVNQLKTNIDTIKSLIAPRPLFVTVKANAYGHGIIKISKQYEKLGVDTLCVASFYEGLEIRDKGVKTNILILAPVPTDREIIKEGIKKNISFTVCSYELAEFINEIAKGIGKEALVHVKVDTGMSRVGVLPSEAFEFINYTKNLPFVKCVGVFTHLAAADDIKEDTFTKGQINIMKDLKEKIGDESIIFHVANSAGILYYPEAYFDAVRGGIVVYGYMDKSLREKYPIRPVLSFKSHIIHIKTLEAGISIGYNRTFVTERKTRVATVSCGYGDGYPRALSNKGFVFVNGQRAKIIGRICMDIFMIDVTDIKAELFDDVMLYDWHYEETDIENIACELGTISYELLTQISARVKRVYKE